ncbi:MAG: AlpA family phage regulatory protein, partial [SAR324 cluster bacterium]|nr:AlpA family phage regulatory protein [SAR324 cluster bacterium]
MGDIVKITSLSKATIYRYINREDFPKQVQIGLRRVAWHESDILDWI